MKGILTSLTLVQAVKATHQKIGVMIMQRRTVGHHVYVPAPEHGKCLLEKKTVEFLTGAWF
jgi:hypothetical protein